MEERPEDNERVYWSSKGEIIRDPRFVAVVGRTDSGMLEAAPALAPPLIREGNRINGRHEGRAVRRELERVAGRVSPGLDKPLELERSDDADGGDAGGSEGREDGG